MDQSNSKPGPIDVFLRIALVTFILGWCILIARPFLVLMIWAAVLAISLYPVHQFLLKYVGGKKILAASILCLLLLVVIFLPSFMLGQSLAVTARDLSDAISNQSFVVPAPNEDVRTWPFIGEQLYQYWVQAEADLPTFLGEFREPLLKAGGWLLSGLVNIMTDLALSVISLIIAGAFMVYAESLYSFFNKLGARLLGQYGHEYVTTGRDTIRSVVKGIILVAIIQALFAYIGFAAVGLQAAGILTILVLIAAVVQLPVTIISVPVAIYVFTIKDTTPAVIFAIYIFAVGLIDNVLKPVLLGRGLKTPMLVILIGALGGLAAHGMLGLFIGPVVLALGYRSIMMWIETGHA